MNTIEMSNETNRDAQPKRVQYTAKAWCEPPKARLARALTF